MPIYEYQCRRCGHRLEAMQRLSDPPLKRCPSCGGGLKKLVSAPAFQFKGSGWYVTDYAGKGAGSKEAKAEAKGEAKAEGKGEGKGESRAESGKAAGGESASAKGSDKGSSGSSKGAGAKD